MSLEKTAEAQAVLEHMMSSNPSLRLCALWQFLTAADADARVLSLACRGLVEKFAGTEAARDLQAFQRVVDLVAATIAPYALAAQLEMQKPPREERAEPDEPLRLVH